MLHRLLLVLIQQQLTPDQSVSLYQLAGGKADRKVCRLGVICDQMHDSVQAPVNGPAVFALIAEILTQWPLLVLRHVNGVIHQFVHTKVFCCRDGHHRHTQQGLHGVYIDAAAVGGDLIHHIERNDHGHVHLQQLHGQIQVPLDIGGVHYIDDRLWLLVEDKIPRYDLLTGIRRHGIDPRKVRHQRLRVVFDLSVLSVHGDTGEIANVLIGSRKLIEERCFSAVLVSHQSKGELRPLRQRIAASLGMILAALAQSRMKRRPGGLRLRILRRPGAALHKDPLRVRQTNRQLVPVDEKFHRIAHGRVFHNRYRRAGDQPHVQKMLAQRSFSSNRFDNGALADLQFP